MFQTRKATEHVDKVYALLGMSTDDPGEAGLLADYRVPWETVLRKLVTIFLSAQMSIQTWPDMEVVVIEGKGCVLGEVYMVEDDTTRNGRQKVGITWMDTHDHFDVKENMTSHFTLQAAAKAIQLGDFICLFQGASQPTVIRLRNDYLTVIRIAVPFSDDPGHGAVGFSWQVRSTTVFPDDFLLVWDWDTHRHQSVSGDYEEFKSSQGLPSEMKDSRTASDKATRLWNARHVLESLKGGQEARKASQQLREVCEVAFRSADNPTPTSLEALEELIVKGTGRFVPLVFAAREGLEAVVRHLLERGAYVDTKDRSGDTPLLCGARMGHAAVVRHLLDKDAQLEMTDRYGKTPLLWAAVRGHEEVVRQLLDRGAYIESEDLLGDKPLLVAAEYGHEAVLRKLLDKGEDIEARDRQGNTPLLVAAEYGHEAVVRVLHEKGADGEVRDRHGSTPLLVAASYGHEVVVRLLLDKGAEYTKVIDSFGMLTKPQVSEV
jgi:ankyrin repeat protein